MESVSFIHNDQGLPLKFTTMPALLDKRARDTPGKPAFIFRRMADPDELERKVLTFSELAAKSSNLAASMLLMGIKSRDKIAVIGSNCPEYILLENACFRINVLMLRLPETLINREVLIQTLNKYQVRALVLDDVKMENKLEEMVPGLLGPDPSRRAAEHELSQLVHIFSLRQYESSFGTRLAVDSMCDTRQDTQSILQIQRTIDQDDAAVIYPTSGSTGDPKFVLFSHFNIINIVSLLHESFKQPVDDHSAVYMSDRPFSWIGGFSTLPVVSGDTQVSLTNLASTTNERVSVFVDSAREENVGTAMCMGYMLYDLMNTMRNRQIELPKPLQHIVTTGEQIPSDVIEFAKRNFTRVSLFYGATETLGAVGTSGDISWMAPMKSVQIKIVDDAECLLPLGEVGNVFCRSMLRMSGYLDDAESTNEVFTSAGWYRTGDVGLINNHGHLKVIGRTKEVISIGGNKVYPVAVESLVFKHPKIRNVVAVAVPDPRLFNEVCACVIPEIDQVLSVSELKSFCDQQVLGDNSLVVPRYYLILNEFPLGSTGKVDKKRLTEMAINSIM